MIFWIGILAGALFAWLAIKLRFFETLAVLFNIVIAIYVAVFLTPVIIDFIPAAGDILVGNALTMLALSVAVFLILFGISYTFITGQFNVPFPKIFNVIVAPLLGFLAGFLLLSFAAFIICTTPVSQNKYAKEVGLSRNSQQANIAYLCWWCDLVHGFASSEDSPKSTEQAIDGYFCKAEKKIRKEPVEYIEPNEPNFVAPPNEPNFVAPPNEPNLIAPPNEPPEVNTPPTTLINQEIETEQIGNELLP